MAHGLDKISVPKINKKNYYDELCIFAEAHCLKASHLQSVISYYFELIVDFTEALTQLQAARSRTLQS